MKRKQRERGKYITRTDLVSLRSPALFFRSHERARATHNSVQTRMLSVCVARYGLSEHVFCSCPCFFLVTLLVTVADHLFILLPSIALLVFLAVRMGMHLVSWFCSCHGAPTPILCRMVMHLCHGVWLLTSGGKFCSCPHPVRTNLCIPGSVSSSAAALADCADL